jgi:small subunit ribosomal protein S19e
MTTMYDVPADLLIRKVSEELKKVDAITPPQWVSFVKTGAHKERAPEDPDWWYVRAAAVLRKTRLLGPIGVSKLRREYGGKKDRGMKPGRFVKGSGNILRKIFQQLEAAELIQKSKTSKAGRILAPKGVSILDGAAAKVVKEMPKPKAPEAKPAKKAEATKKPAKKEAEPAKEAEADKE